MEAEGQTWVGGASESWRPLGPRWFGGEGWQGKEAIAVFSVAGGGSVTGWTDASGWAGLGGAGVAVRTLADSAEAADSSGSGSSELLWCCCPCGCCSQADLGQLPSLRGLAFPHVKRPLRSGRGPHRRPSLRPPGLAMGCSCRPQLAPLLLRRAAKPHWPESPLPAAVGAEALGVGAAAPLCGAAPRASPVLLPSWLLPQGHQLPHEAGRVRRPLLRRWGWLEKVLLVA